MTFFKLFVCLLCIFNYLEGPHWYQWVITHWWQLHFTVVFWKYLHLDFVILIELYCAWLMFIFGLCYPLLNCIVLDFEWKLIGQFNNWLFICLNKPVAFDIKSKIAPVMQTHLLLTTQVGVVDTLPIVTYGLVLTLKYLLSHTVAVAVPQGAHDPFKNSACTPKNDGSWLIFHVGIKIT